MNILNDLLLELDVSKVNLAKYLGVSRQMVYNYLDLDSLNDWPKDKKIAMFKLLDIDDGDNETIENIVVDTEYLLNLTDRLNEAINESEYTDFLSIKDLKKDDQKLVNDLVYIIKDMLSEKDNKENIKVISYIFNLLQTIDNLPEVKYLLGYLAKYNGYIPANEFAFNEENQFLFEGIVHSAFNLYRNGTPDKSKVIKIRQHFIDEINTKKEEILSRTMQINHIQKQALRELGYKSLTEIDETNAAEFWEKLAEIETRGV